MDVDDAKRTLNHELKSIASRRRRYLVEADELTREIGATATFLREELGQSKAASAEFAGISPSHMTEYMARAAEACTQIEDPLQRVPLLQGAAVSDFSERHGGLMRILASHWELSDTLYLSGLHPSRLQYGGRLLRGTVLIQASDGEWAVLDDTTVGYNGTGPSNTYRILEGLGVDEELARQVAYNKVSDIHFNGSQIVSQIHGEAPLVGRAVPRLFRSRWVVGVDVDGHGQADDGDFADWLDFLDAPPEWAAGPRRARAYLSRRAAREDGFTGPNLLGRSGLQFGWQEPQMPTVFTVVVEQGELQLWLGLPTSADATTQFTPETYAILRDAGFYVDDHAHKDARAAFWRWLAGLGTTRPPFVDLGSAIHLG